MDSKRREFLRNFGSKAATAAASMATPAVSYWDQFSDEVKKLSTDFNQKLSSVTDQVSDQVSQLSNRVDAAAMTQAYQQAQLHIIFLLLLISFAIDGGMSLMWILN